MVYSQASDGVLALMIERTDIMKVVILAGGYGTRISEESHLKPKPMVEIGEKPILWHIMKGYSAYGYNDFIICCGYKQHVIKEWFADYYLYNSDVTFDFTNDNRMTVHNNVAEPWKVTLVDTGLDTMTGGRIKRIRKYVGDERFMLTYGDAVSDIDINRLLAFHEGHGKLVTITAISVNERFGVLDIDDNDTILTFREKSDEDRSRISGGFMVLEPGVFDHIDGDGTVFEKDTLKRLSEKGQLKAYRHEGFWQCMDTKREKDYLEKLWESGNAPWKLWED
jgi:glucose-1-phosphate cytidylyltransferase